MHIEINEVDILIILSPYTQITWDEFFKLIPGITSGGRAVLRFEETVHTLLKNKFIESTLLANHLRYWRITDLGRQHLMIVALKNED